VKAYCVKNEEPKKAIVEKKQAGAGAKAVEETKEEPQE